MIPINNVTRPSQSAIRYLGRSVIQSLFHKQYQGNKIKYNKEDIIQLLNFIGTRIEGIYDMKFNWGDAVLSLSAPKQALHDIGVRGNAIKHHNKQAIISSHVVFDENDNVLNKKWLKNMAPHKSDKGATKYVNKCIDIRREFNKGFTDILCIVQDKQHRNSMIYTTYIISK